MVFERKGQKENMRSSGKHFEERRKGIESVISKAWRLNNKIYIR
jgi:hypothetical protein